MAHALLVEMPRDAQFNQKKNLIMKKNFLIITAIVVLAGCSGGSESADTLTNSSLDVVPVGADQQEIKNSEKITIAASFYPLAYMAQRIGGEAVEVSNIVGAADPHDYSLSPGDVAKLTDADIVLLQGASYEPWGEDIEKQRTEDGKVVTVVTERLTLKENDDHGDEHDDHGDEHAQSDQDGEHSDEHGDEHDDHEEEGHAEEGERDDHGHGAYDPHTWLDPVLAGQTVDIIAASLSATDPTNKEAYATNAAALKKDFTELDVRYKDGLSQCARTDVIVSHDAFGYLADRYNFTVHAIAGISTQDEPSAKTLAVLKKEAEDGITHILAEATSVNRFAKTLSSETGLVMLPISALAARDDKGSDFFQSATENLTQLQIALGCTQ